jgi:hypothetical protein
MKFLDPGSVDTCAQRTLRSGGVVGWRAALNVTDALVSSPGALAWVIDAAGGLALDHAGRIALERALA